MQAFFQCLTRDLILSVNIESATDREDGDGAVQLPADGFLIWSFAASSCALDKYDMPARHNQLN